MDRRRLLSLSALAGLGGLAGCGVASRNGLVVDGPGPSAGNARPAVNSPPLRRETQDSARRLVDNFMHQPAGDPSDTKAALARWRAYMTDEFAKLWEGESRVMVVWYEQEPVQTELPDGDLKLTYEMIPLGRMDKYGQVNPSSDGRRRVDFIVSSRKNKTVKDDQVKPDRVPLYISRVDNAPDGMLLSTNALSIYYDYRPLYFWDRASRVLVPDGRYVPRAWEWQEATREKTLLDWLLLAGPPAWLAPVVQDLDGLSMLDLPGKVGLNNMALNFTGVSPDTDLGRLVSQLTWTLLPECKALGGDRANSPIIVKVDSVEKKTGGPFLADNVTAVKATQPKSQQAFVIDERRVRRLKNAGNDADRPVPLIDERRDIEWAAFYDSRRTGDPTHAAIVTRDGKGKTAFWVSPSAGAKPVAVPALTGKQMSQPVFVDSEFLLVIAEGHLHQVRASTAKAVDLRLGITAFSVPADGRRIAYILGGKLFVGALTRSENGLSISGARRIASVLSNLSGVAFTAECWLAVAGTYGDEARVVEMSLDGAMVGNPVHPSTAEGWLAGDLGIPVVTSLTASWDSPTKLGPSRRIFITSNGRAQDATSLYSSLATEVIGEPAGKSPVNAFFLQ